MTRFIYDQFSKDLLEILLSPYGEVEGGKRVSSEVREIDVWFVPKEAKLPSELGLLGKMVQGASLFEPYRNPVDSGEICDCMLKLFSLRGQFQREANRKKQRLRESGWPQLWILTPTASATIIRGIKAEEEEDWSKGIYFTGETFRTGLVVIHQLPPIPETLWLRLMGRGNVQKQAINELEALPSNNSIREAILELLYNLQQNLELSTEKDQDDQELMMRLKPLYQENKEKAVQEGEANLVIRQLKRKISEISSQLESQVRQLSIEQLENLGEALLDFQSESDLRNWLSQHN
ncbi:MAG: DUF4351 domain-containing protein [Crocinitomicaceae bacterium]|nr:DUF4351 domain-containing protein [Crocinitomicaceae bacterium]